MASVDSIESVVDGIEIEESKERFPDVVEFKFTDEETFKPPVDGVIGAGRLPDDTILIFPGEVRTKFVEVRFPCCNCGARFMIPGRLLCKIKGDWCEGAGAICTNCVAGNWAFGCEVLFCGCCCVAMSCGTLGSLIVSNMFVEAGVIKQVPVWLAFDTIVGAVACCLKNLQMRHIVKCLLSHRGFT